MRREHRWCRIKAALHGVGRKVNTVRRRRGRRFGFVRKSVRFVLAAIFGDSVVHLVAFLWQVLSQLFSG